MHEEDAKRFEKEKKEIAEIIGTNPNNIGVRVKRIKTKLKTFLKKGTPGVPRSGGKLSLLSCLLSP